METTTDVVIVGAGLAGLAAGSYLARGGRRVSVLERASSPGGRARSTSASGFCFNLGPHALYASGAGSRVLRELGVPFSGAIPRPSGYVAVCANQQHSLPAGFISLVATDLLPFSGKVEYARILVTVARMDPVQLMGVSLREWFDQMKLRAEVRAVIEALVRIATYAHAPELLSTGAAIRQLQTALEGGVYYLDGGWQTLVNGLVTACQGSGVRLRCSTGVLRVVHDNGEVQGVELKDGSFLPCHDVIIAATPDSVRALISDDSF